MPNLSDAWAAALASWSIPTEIQALAPEDPWTLTVAPFARAALAATQRDSSATRQARDALTDGGVLLDVGCGAGAGSLPLAANASRIIGVDFDARMLDAFRNLAAELQVAVELIEGRWPDIASTTPTADVIVCHHVLYNIPDIVPFVQALTARATRRVICELTAEHPRAWMNPHWAKFHGLARPHSPTAFDLVPILEELGIESTVSVSRVPAPARDLDEVTEMVRRQLCLRANRDPEVRAALDDSPPPAVREIVTISWDGQHTR